MKKMVLLSVLVSMGAVSAVEASSIVLSGVSINAAGILTVRDDFRTAIGGGTVAGAAGSFERARVSRFRV